MSTYMTLGQMEMELLSSPTAFDTKSSANYAEHQLIGKKSLLHLTGFSPDDISITIRLHGIYCDPAEQIQKLKDMKDKAMVVPLVFASGNHLGTYVVKAVDTAITETDASGALLSADVNLSLGEYVGDPAKPNPPGVWTAGVKINITTDPTIPDLSSPQGLLATVQTAVKVAGEVQKAASRVNDIVASAQNGDVLGAVGLAGAYAPELAEMAGKLPVEQFKDLEQVKTVAVDAGNVAKGLSQARDNIALASNSMANASALSGLSSAANSMGTAVDAVGATAPAMARLQALSQVGSRLAGVAP